MARRNRNSAKGCKTGKQARYAPKAVSLSDEEIMYLINQDAKALRGVRR